MDAGELGLEGVVSVHGDGEAADGDGDAGSDPGELEAQGAGGGAGEAGVCEGGAEADHENRGEG